MRKRTKQHLGIQGAGVCAKGSRFFNPENEEINYTGSEFQNSKIMINSTQQCV